MKKSEYENYFEKNDQKTQDNNYISYFNQEASYRKKNKDLSNLSFKSRLFKDDNLPLSFSEGNAKKFVTPNHLPKKSKTFVFVLGNNLINSKESYDFNFPVESTRIFQNKYANDDGIHYQQNNQLFKRNEADNSPIQNQFTKHKKNNSRYTVPDNVIVQMKKSAQASQRKMNKLYQSFREPEVQTQPALPFKEYFKKYDYNEGNEQLPELLDSYCQQLSSNDQFIQSMQNHYDSLLKEEEPTKEEQILNTGTITKPTPKFEIKDISTQNKSTANNKQFGHNSKLSPGKDVRDTNQLMKSFKSLKNDEYDKMYNKMEKMKYGQRNYFEDAYNGTEDFDVNKCFSNAEKDFEKLSSYEDRMNWIKNRNTKILNEVKHHEFTSGLDLQQMEEAISGQMGGSINNRKMAGSGIAPTIKFDKD